jgi:hypothetical protein
MRFTWNLDGHEAPIAGKGRASRAIALLLALVGATGSAASDPLPGSTLPPAVLADRQSRPVQWAPGRVCVFSFFAFWCDTWKDQSPRLLKARSALAGLPVDVITVSVDGRWTDVPGYNATLPLLLDRAGWSAKIGIDRVPTTVIVDQAGQVRWVRSGVVRTEDLIREARAALHPASEGAVILRIENFPPPTGGFELLDVLRRLNVHATLGLKPGVKPTDALVRQAVSEGHSLAGPIPKHGLVDPYDQTRPGQAEIVRRAVLAANAGATIVLHAEVLQTCQALPELVSALRKKGLTLQ